MPSSASCTASARHPDRRKTRNSSSTTQYPLTSNDPAVTAKVAAAFKTYFGDRAFTVPRLSASEDFSIIPDALGVPYTYWALGGIDAELWQKAEAAGRISSDIPGNHSPKFAPVIEPTLETGPRRSWSLPLAWLAAEEDAQLRDDDGGASGSFAATIGSCSG